MATSCYNVVRGKKVRVTRLDACGAYPVAGTPDALVISDGYISVQYTLDYEDGDEHIQKNANGDLCIIDRSEDKFKRVMVTISFCAVDPALLEVITGEVTEVDSAGNTVGLRISRNIVDDAANFSLELWSGTGGNACAGVNEVQSITEGGAGLTSFTLTATVPGYIAATTASIPASTTSAAIQAALEALDGIDPGDVSVTGPAGATTGPWLVTFQGRYAGQNIVQMTSTPTGGTGTVTIATVRGGGGSLAQFGYFLLPLVKNGTLRDFTVENGPTTFEVQGWTEGSGQWLKGPFNVVASGAGGVPSELDDPLTINDHLLLRVTTVAPPAAQCGYQIMPAAPTPSI